MEYTISQAAEKMHLTAHTLRYYDKEGLLPFVTRTDGGIRHFTDSDVEWLSVICCLKGTGMPVKKIKEYIDLCMQGDETLEARRQIFIKQREEVLNKINQLTRYLEKVDYKIKHYDEACAMYEERMQHFINHG